MPFHTATNIKKYHLILQRKISKDMRSKRVIFRFILGISAGAAGLISLSGCGTTKAVSNPAPQQVAIQAESQPTTPPQQDFVLYPWENDTLTAVGTGLRPEGQLVAQATLSAKNSARINAINNLKQQVRELPVGSDQTVGSIMDTYLLIRRGVEKQLQDAATVSGDVTLNGTYELTVSMPLKPLAELLEKYAITPSEELPPVPDNHGFRPII